MRNSDLALPPDLNFFCQILFHGIRDLFQVDNFYVAIHDPKTDLITFPYFQDTRDPAPKPRKPGRGLTDYVLFEGAMLWWKDPTSRRRFNQTGYHSLGTDAEDWLGAPLTMDGRVFGVVAVQSYEPGRMFQTLDRDRLLVIAQHLSSFLYLKHFERMIHLLERAVEATADGVVITDYVHPDHPIVYVNPAFEKITGYCAAEALGQNCRFLQKTDRQQPALKQVYQALRNQETVTVVLRNYRKDGRLFWNELHVAPIARSDGRVTHYVGIQHDITAIHEAREEQERLSEALAQLEEMVMITDPAGSIAYVNPSFERVTGYRRDEVIGRNPKMFKSGRHDGDFYRAMWACLNAGKVWRGHVVNRRKNGEPYEEYMVISPVRAPSGEVRNYVCVKRDVTRERALEHQANLARQMEMVGNLAGGLAHDFNNLLVAIINNAEFVREALPPDSQAGEDIRAVIDAARRSGELTRQLLAFSRRTDMNVNVINLNDVVGGMERILRRLVGESVTLTLDVCLDSLLVRADAGQVEQVLVNLVVNARDALPTGGEIVLETRRLTSLEGEDPASFCAVPRGDVPAWCVLTVRDNGTGIPPETIKQIFEPFFTTKEPGRGTGLGLATVYGIVEKHQGFIGVTSALRAGTTFSIYLPEALEAELVAGEEPPDPESLPVGRETILVAEDDPAARRVICRILASLGYRVLDADCGAEAVRVALQHREAIALLFTDIIMPDFDGKTLSDQVRTLIPGIRIIYTSGYPDNYLSQTGVLDGTHLLIRKPYDIRDIAESVRAVLDG